MSYSLNGIRPTAKSTPNSVTAYVATYRQIPFDSTTYFGKKSSTSTRIRHGFGRSVRAGRFGRRAIGC